MRRARLFPVVHFFAGALTFASSAALPPQGGVSPQASASLVEIFEILVPGTPVPFLAGVDSLFVVADQEGNVSAYSAAEGSPVWTIRLDSPATADPFAGGETLALLSGETTLVLLSTESGMEIARHEVEAGTSIIRPTTEGLFVGEPSGRTTLLSLVDGTTLWIGSLSSPPSAGGVLCKGLLLVGSADGALYGLNPQDGSIVMKRRIGGTITTPASCSGKMAYIGSSDDYLHAIRVKKRSLKPKWRYRTGGDLIGTPVLYDGYLLFFSYDTYLYALNEKNGHLEWKVRLGRRPRQRSVMLDDILLTAPLHTETLEGFQLPGGGQAFSFGLPEGLARFVTAPSLAGGHIAIGAAGYGGEDSRVIGLRLQHARSPE